ncbi:MAG: phage head-tail adapter protein [Leuconostoc sp.]|nr:phage head-tail adapter protein [Leuconostoc sp.]
MKKPEFEYRAPKVKTGDLRTPVSFYRYIPHHGPEPGEEEEELVHSCYAEIYNPSMKDRDILTGIDVKQSVTINIRDPHEDYMPSNKDYVEIDDRRYQGLRWNVYDVRNDFTENAFITILLVVFEDGR